MVLWVFGYGSLVWNPGFDFDERIIGFIKDYRRVFDLACIDHRGTPENPARTLTLEDKKGSVCWGAAYCVSGGADKEAEAIKYLERRECEYDKKISVRFYKEGDCLSPAITGVLVFVSTPDRNINKYYLGPAPYDQMASVEKCKLQVSDPNQNSKGSSKSQHAGRDLQHARCENHSGAERLSGKKKQSGGGTRIAREFNELRELGKLKATRTLDIKPEVTREGCSG